MESLESSQKIGSLGVVDEGKTLDGSGSSLDGSHSLDRVVLSSGGVSDNSVGVVVLLVSNSDFVGVVETGLGGGSVGNETNVVVD